MSHENPDCNLLSQGWCNSVQELDVNSLNVFDGDENMVWFLKLILSLVFGKLIGKALDKLIR